MLVVVVAVLAVLTWLGHLDISRVLGRMDRAIERMDRSIDRMDRSAAAAGRAADGALRPLSDCCCHAPVPVAVEETAKFMLARLTFGPQNCRLIRPMDGESSSTRTMLADVNESPRSLTAL